MNQNPESLGAQIAIWRKADGITQRALAAQSGVPLTAIRRCEQKGQIPMDRYMKLVAVLGGSIQPVRPRPNPPGRNRKFWKEHHGVGLVWSNPDAGDDVMIDKALLSPSFHLLLDIARQFGLERVDSQWENLQLRIEESRYPEEMRRLNHARPIVNRCLGHMKEAVAQSH